MSTLRQSSWGRRLAAVASASLLWVAPLAVGQSTTGPAGAALREVGRIELPGVSGRIDHLAVDLEGKRLFVAALGADEVEVIDLQAGKRVAQLKGLREAQGVVYVPTMRRLFVAAGESGEVVAFEGEKRVGTATGLPDADNMRVFAPIGRLVVGFGHGLAILDPATLAVVQRIALPGHPEAFELAEHGPEIYVNVPEVGHIVVVDRRTGKTTAEWNIEPEAANFPMALDEAAHRLYVGTRRPARLLVYDTTNGQRVSKTPLCGDVDDLFIDSARTQVLAVCGAGEVDVFSSASVSETASPRRVSSSSGARTGLYVPSTNTLFVAAPARGEPAQILVYRTE
jgi:DNA-binding beta-propeller fold protein YncE